MKPEVVKWKSMACRAFLRLRCCRCGHERDVCLDCKQKQKAPADAQKACRGGALGLETGLTYKARPADIKFGFGNGGLQRLLIRVMTRRILHGIHFLFIEGLSSTAHGGRSTYRTGNSARVVTADRIILPQFYREESRSKEF